MTLTTDPGSAIPDYIAIDFDGECSQISL